MVAFFIMWIEKGNMTIDEVPAHWYDEVKMKMEK